ADEAGGRVSEELSKLDVEDADLRVERDAREADRAATADGLRRAQESAEASMHARTARETELASTRIERGWRSNGVRAKEREQAEAGIELIRQENAGRCGFLVLDAVVERPEASVHTVASGFSRTSSDDIIALCDVVTITGAHRAAIACAIGEAWIADDLNHAL